MCCAVLAIASPIMLLMSILTFGRGLWFNIAGIVMGGYFLYDAYNFWIVSVFTDIFLSDNMMLNVISITWISLILNVLMIVFTLIIYPRVGKTDVRFWILYTIVFLYIGAFKFTKTSIQSHGTFNTITYQKNEADRKAREKAKRLEHLSGEEYIKEVNKPDNEE